MGNKLTKKITSVLLSATTAVWLSGSAMLLPIANAQSADLQAQINLLLSQITALQAQLASQGGAVVTACSFTRDLTVGAKGDDVKCLQQYLNGKGYKIAASGAGSPGNETTTFGSLTKAAAAKWQAANGVSPAMGYFGSISRAKYASSAGAAPVVTTPGATPVAGAGLSAVLAPNQPVSGLFGESFASRPFTKVILTAGTTDVTVKSLTVERTGQTNDAIFSGVIALDENDIRIGTAKTFGSDHRLRLTDKFVVKAGQSKTITLAGDSDNNQNDYQGELASLSLVGVETVDGSPVTASYPLTGNLMTVNSTLSVGTLTLTRGTYDPGSGQTKEIGVGGYIFSGLTLTAGATEDVLVTAMKWNQSGSAGSKDLNNVKIVLDGVSYEATVSDDGKYYTAKFGEGVKILKGFTKEVHIKGDILDGSGRTADFDLYRYADLQVRGLTYGYSILPSATELTADNDDDGEFQDTEPRFDAFQAQIGAGTIQVLISNKVPASNVALNLSNQSLGAFDVIVKGEEISVAQTIFRLGRWNGSSGTASTQDVTSITLVDNATNKVVAGPVDITASSPNVTFSDTITFPVGTNTYVLKGKLGTDYASDDTVAASTTPSTNWSTVRGLTSATTITPTPAVAITANTMTIKAGALRVSTSPTPVAQTVVAGIKNLNLANFSFDTTASGEDVRLNSAQVEFNFGQANSNDDLTNCQLWDGSKALNTGSNVVDGLNADATAIDKTFSFDESLVIPKGLVKTLALKCNTTATTTTAISTYNWTIEIPGDADDVTPTGTTSGSAIVETYNDTTGQAITMTGGGSLSVSLDSASPSVSLTNANTTNNILTVLGFAATNEDIDVTQLGLVLGGVASNTPQDLVKVTIWDGATKVSEVVFTSDNATATLAGFIIPKDGYKTLTLKADIAAIGTSDAARPGHLVKVEYDGAAGDSAGDATRGSGVASGSTIYSTGSITASAGTRIFKAVPTLTRIALPSNTLVNANIPLYRFSVTAPSTGSVSLYKFTFSIATSTSGVTTFAITDLNTYGYNDSSFSTAGYANSGLLNSVSNPITSDGSALYGFRFDPTTVDGTAAGIVVPAGSTRYFELTGTVANMSATSSTVTVNLQGDAGYTKGTNNAATTTTVTGIENADVGADNWVGTSAGIYAYATTAANVDADTTQDDFIWSGNSTTTSGVAHYDWVNGFSVVGLPSTNMTSNVLTP